MSLPSPESQPSFRLEEVDIGKVQRRLYIAGEVVGSILSVYARQTTTVQISKGLSCSAETAFDRPWFFSVMMSLGMSLALAVFRIHAAVAKESQPLFTLKSLGFTQKLLVLAATLCDVYFSVAFTIAGIYVGSSMSVALRFFDIFFVFLLARFYLKRMFMPYSTMSFVFIIVGLAFVSLAEILQRQNEKTSVWAAVFQTTAQFVSALKSVIEEKLTHKTAITPVCLCGMEGVCELVIILTIVYPIMYITPTSSSGVHEDLCDAVMMLVHNNALIGMFFIYPFISCMFNICVIGVIQMRNAATFSVLEMVNTAIVWAIDLFIFHVLKGSLGFADGLGVEWARFSPIHLIGAVFVVAGGLVYIRALEFPCFKYEEAQVATMPINAPEKMSDSHCGAPVTL